MADMAHVAGLIAGGVHPNPLDYGFHVMTTTTHKTCGLMVNTTDKHQTILFMWPVIYFNKAVVEIIHIYIWLILLNL